MAFKIFLFCVAVASVQAGVLHSALRYETPIIASAPAAIKYEIPPTSRVEHLAPVVTTSYGYSTVPLKHEVVAPAVKIAAPVLKVETPIAVAAPAIHVETPAITRVEHLAPAVASSYKTEVITPPKVHVTHTPAVAKIEHFPTIAKIEHAIPTLKTELLTAPVASHISIAQPALRFETPAITKVEHLAPSIASSFRTEVVSAPAVKYETSHVPLLHVASPTIAKIEHLSPSIHVSAPIAKTEFISHPSLKIASFDHGLHGISLKHLGHESFVF
ncbi:hypothetical protein RN001_015295 [Aquatica leii]|uniref:Cuticle protein n=1 Tax=Aquatica leii TaxID=1421715 RepID=A0AAN7P0V0_9COLE|nr:hypothetical protein RN001_015295 [Aquatica leii]